jgi:Protein of unknown function (DUF669)
MPKIKLELDDVEEAVLVPEGEYELQIVRVEDGESKKGNEMTTIWIKVLDSEVKNPNLVRHWLTYPTSETPPDQLQMRLLDIKRFLHCFGIDAPDGEVDSDEFQGATGKATIVQEEGDDGNTYNRLRLPRLKKSKEKEKSRMRG